MKIILDVRTIVFANFIYSAAISVFLLYFGARRDRRLSGLQWWAYGFLLFSLNFGILIFLNFIPVWITNIVPHFLTVLGLLMIKRGLALFYRLRPRIWPDSLLSAVILIALIFASSASVQFRVFVITTAAILSYLSTLTMLRRLENIEILRFLYVFSGLIQLIRLWLGFRIPIGTNPMDAGTNMSFISMLFFLSQVIIALALISIIVRRLIHEKEILLQREKKMSVTDELTGLLNRRGFKAVFDVESQRVGRKRLAMSIAMLDIDDFKEVNDRFGHDCGDEVLKRIAKIISSQFRGADILARWGGEEFVVVQPESKESDCRSSLERTRSAISRESFTFKEIPISVTVSFGFHTSNSGSMSFDGQLKRADENLYKAKKSGKNKVVGGSSD
ncbi:MAG: diguanylate cyclase [Spirochaetaceae bacterium]|nr:diguanylate cyclase [Spirochaetaceae bacterium]